MAATFLLVRHAEHTDYNRHLSGLASGIALSERGRMQAKATGRRLADAGLAAVECSPLERTRATAEAIAAAAALPPPSCAPALIEIDMGDWTGRALDSFGDNPAWHAWNERRASARIPGGESMAEAQARITGYLTRTAREREGLAIAVVTHADLIRAAVAWAIGLSLDNLLRFDIDAASVTRMVVGDWGARLLSLNETGV